MNIVIVREGECQSNPMLLVTVTDPAGLQISLAKARNRANAAHAPSCTPRLP